MNKNIIREAELEYVAFLELNIDNVIAKVIGKNQKFEFTGKYSREYWIKLVENRYRKQKLNNLNK